MNANNLNWDQIKELANMAIKNNSDFVLSIDKNGDVRLNITPQSNVSNYPYWPPCSPTITYTTNPKQTKDYKITVGDSRIEYMNSNISPYTTT
jgi:hypothetical protein